MATGVKSWSATAANNATADSNVTMSEGMAPSLVNDGIRYIMKAVADWYLLIDGGVITGATVGGTADVITLTCSPTVDALAAGQCYLFVAGGTITTAPTITVDSTAATALRYKDVALIAGDIASGDVVFAYYNGTRFQMLNPPRLSGFVTDWPTDTSGGDVADLIVLADASQSNAINKTTVQKVLDNALTSLTADATPDVADSLMTYDASATATKTTTVTNFYKTINTLTADGTGATGDKIPTYDVSASGAKYILVSTLQTLLAAVQATQETATSTALFVTPGVQQFHPSAAKAWLIWTAGGTTITASNNVASIARTAAGDYTVTFTTAFSSTNYSVVATAVQTAGTGKSRMMVAANLATGTCDLYCVNGTDSKTENNIASFCAAFYGDQ